MKLIAALAIVVAAVVWARSTSPSRQSCRTRRDAVHTVSVCRSEVPTISSSHTISTSPAADCSVGRKNTAGETREGA